ncbi:MAG TPA: LpqB family beta-propeller domain-containing protein [Propionibacteriaceae bacterium]|nr:LpqB family beta-propeller domain-containing protein [Propionibacteriaceae bacterium]
MSRAQRNVAAIFIVLASLLAAAGCVTVPTTGPIEPVEGQQPGCQNCVNVEVAPPAVGAEPREIVEGYLRATSNYQPNYSVARQFLTRMAAEKWSPEAGVSIYRGSPVAAGEKVTFDGTLVGALAGDRTYTARDEPFRWNFGLHKEQDGEWRIDNPPPGLMVDEFWFKSFYQPYDVYFVGNGRSLVPDRIYLPALSNPANVASALMKALLDGPSRWLKPAVSSAIPPNTSLSVDSVTITDDGMAEVPLSDSVLALTDPQRSLLAAQIVYTLRQIGGVKGVLIKANQQPYRVPGSDPNTLAISVDAIPRDLDPIPLVASEQLYAVQERLVAQVTTTSETPAVTKLQGPLGERDYAINALAVSVTNTDIAITTNDRTMLRRAPIATVEPTQPSILLRGKSDLLRPQFTRYGELWVIGREGNRQRIWMFAADEEEPVVIESPGLGDQGVKAFKISPDGTRMALIRRTETGDDVLQLAQIIRSDTITVGPWRTLHTTQTNMSAIRRIQDVAWLDATELLVLGAPHPAATMLAPFRVVEDASRITPHGDPQDWKAAELTVLPRTQSAIIVDRTVPGRTWKYDGNQWLSFVNKVSTAAYPG